MTKYYERMNKDQWEAEKQLEEAENPFGESEDDAFGHDDDFGDFMEEDNDNGDERFLAEETYDVAETTTAEYLREWELPITQSNVDITDEYEDKYYSSDDQEYKEEEDWTDW